VGGGGPVRSHLRHEGLSSQVEELRL
jgi:hypothetical protein